MTQDLLSNTIRLAPWLETETLTFGEWIESRVFVGAPPCDPWGWDAEAPCRKFLFEAPMDGRLVVTLEWTGDPQLDATLVTPSGGYLGISHEAGYERALLEGPVLRSRAYEVRVNSYYGTQDFRLKAELIP
jgi:hypothetical protein